QLGCGSRLAEIARRLFEERFRTRTATAGRCAEGRACRDRGREEKARRAAQAAGSLSAACEVRPELQRSSPGEITANGRCAYSRRDAEVSLRSDGRDADRGS